MEAVNFIQKHFKDIDKIFAYRYYKKQHYTCCDLLLVQVVSINRLYSYLPVTVKILSDDNGKIIYNYENYKLIDTPFPHLAKNYTELEDTKDAEFQYHPNFRCPVEMQDFTQAFNLFLSNDY